MTRRALQVVTAILGLLTIVLAAMQFALGADSPVYASLDLPEAPVLDSNLRFFAGMGLGLGFGLLWVIPAIERRTTAFRLIWCCAFLGGVGRALSMLVVGLPSLPLIIFTAIEVPLVPLMILWQARVAQRAALQRLSH